MTRIRRFACLSAPILLFAGCSMFLTLAGNSYKGNLDAVRNMVERQHANVNKREHAGLSPLMGAAAGGHPDVVKYLLAHGAEVNVTNDQWQTPLMLAATAGNLECVTLLLDAGAKVDAKARGGATVLGFAVATGHLDIIQLLVQRGVDINQKGSEGSNCLAWVEDKHADLVPELVKLGANPSQGNDTGETPLIVCAYASRPLVAKALLAAGADFRAKDLRGETALVYAKRNKKKDVAKILEAAGATE
jgi:ankyrin repeat protein